MRGGKQLKYLTTKIEKWDNVSCKIAESLIFERDKMNTEITEVLERKN